ncbi:TetR family transcriptional regulator [Rhodococcus hoagii]|uniref:TetR/AcrR family transcriptional regulator n=1 Tax=Rhodococcus hoagii TaxID=43767 RepID=UPI0007CD6F4D|nr:TetR/AcrR family transcriptional regulator [Prescottella equi]MBM4473546.1 TetR family transcriptional regulator [Prescottella equi]MBM4483677.1 TetR family transcriptional regulator [Prescottella equi]MBM4534342.1 TetR family transcriptional regulator [Prescottella equi]MBM9838822.1 TetR/AcrR family transcriptional regulator C-terminal ligand-binding domain-containing protein [Prescottella equi]NKR83768.1 TetR family transcriptional regulator [Prescottella equi]
MPVPSAEPRRGGPRKRDLVLRTVVDELAVTPYAQLTVERIAEASGVHKTTLYRWWSGKPELVADALATLMDTGPVPDTGSTRDDLVQWLAGTVRNYAGSPLGVAMPALISDLARTPEGLAAFRGAFLAERRTNCVEVIDRGVARGDLPSDLDLDLFMDTLAGAVFYRQVVSGGLVDADLAERVVDLLLPSASGARE